MTAPPTINRSTASTPALAVAPPRRCAAAAITSAKADADMTKKAKMNVEAFLAARILTSLIAER
jgi:hypothetical protein